MKRLIWLVLAGQAAMQPCFADVIPSRRAVQHPAAEAAVQARLEGLGMSATEAERHVQALTPRETDYFGRNPDRIQITGALTWDEWLLGIGGIIFFAGVIYWVLA